MIVYTSFIDIDELKAISTLYSILPSHQRITYTIWREEFIYSEGCVWGSLDCRVVTADTVYRADNNLGDTHSCSVHLSAHYKSTMDTQTQTQRHTELKLNHGCPHLTPLLQVHLQDSCQDPHGWVLLTSSKYCSSDSLRCFSGWVFCLLLYLSFMMKWHLFTVSSKKNSYDWTSSVK